MIANFEAISSGVSALPGAASVATSASAQRAGGFVSMLAAAQSLAVVSQTAADGVETLDGVATGAGSATTLHVATPVAGSLQFRKLNSSSPVTVSTVGAANIILPGLIPGVANPVPVGLPQTNVQPLNLSPTRTSFGRIADDPVAPLSTGLQKSAYEAAPPNELTRDSILSQTAAILGSSASLEQGAGSPSSPSTPGILISRVGGQMSQQETSTTNSPPAILNAVGRAASGDVLSGITPGSGLAGKSALLAESTQPILVSTSGEPLSGMSAVQITIDNRVIASSPADTGLGSVESVPQPRYAVEANVPVSPLQANANLEAGITAGAPLFSVAEVQTAQANSATGITADSLVRAEVSAQAGTENATAAVLNGQDSDSTVLNPAGHLATGTPVLRIDAARVAGAATGANFRAEGPTAASLNSHPSLSLAGSTALKSDNALPIASQTPFSVFFSGPGLGAESAASTLPKMLLPEVSAAIRENHSNAPSQPATNSVTGGQNGVPQVAAPQNAKDSPAGTDAGSLQAGQPIQRNAGTIAASAPVASVQTAAAQVPAGAPISATATALAQTSLPAEAPPKADTLPGNAPSAAATLLQPAAESLPAAAAGPVQLAQLINRVEQSEMRIGMNTAAFGSVEVRAVVHASDVGLVIGSEKGDLRTLLANEIPAITNTLQQQSLRLNSVNFMQGFAFSNNASGGGDSQQRSFVPTRGFAGSELAGGGADDSTELQPAEFGGGSSGLSILA